jgi:hypothetical protein
VPTPTPQNLALLAALLALGACGGERAPEADTTAQAPTPIPARVSAADLERFRWLEGRWRGAEADGAPFFESYQFLDDSTIGSFTWTDSTMSVAADTGRIWLRGDTLTSGWPAPRRVATAVDSLSLHFSAPPGGGNEFTWRSTGPDSWEARLTWDSAGVPRERIYHIQRLP